MDLLIVYGTLGAAFTVLCYLALGLVLHKAIDFCSQRLLNTEQLKEEARTRAILATLRAISKGFIRPPRVY